MVENIVRSRRQFGQILRRIRTEKDLTQEELADKSGVAQDKISKLENNNHNPTLDTVFRLLGALNYEIELRERSGSDEDESVSLGGLEISP